MRVMLELRTYLKFCNAKMWMRKKTGGESSSNKNDVRKCQARQVDRHPWLKSLQRPAKQHDYCQHVWQYLNVSRLMRQCFNNQVQYHRRWNALDVQCVCGINVRSSTSAKSIPFIRYLLEALLYARIYSFVERKVNASWVSYTD